METAEATALLRIVNLDKHFGGLYAVNSFNLQVQQGQIIGLIGPNGSGKTTVFNLITGIIPSDSGHIYFRGQEITHYKPHIIARTGIGRTFQNIRLFQGLNVIDNVKTAYCHKTKYTFSAVLLGTRRMKRIERELTEMAAKLLSQLDLTKVALEPPKNLPYGLQRRLEIARALAVNPQLLLLDEPAAGLNQTEVIEIARFIRRLRDEMKVTVLLIEHHMDIVMSTCDRIQVLNEGITIASGTPREVQNHPEVLRAYIGN